MLTCCTGLVENIIFRHLHFLQRADISMCNLAYYSGHSNISDVIIYKFTLHEIIFVSCKVLNQTERQPKAIVIGSLYYCPLVR
jgi:hypothetical protein